MGKRVQFSVYSFSTLCLFIILLYKSFLMTNSKLIFEASEDTSCRFSSLRYEVTNSIIMGDVLSDYMNIFVLCVDDSFPEVTSEFVVENGILQGKFLHGQRWSISSDLLFSFSGGVFIVGVYNNNRCVTRSLFVNLPLNSYVLGKTIDFDNSYVIINKKPTIVMRGNTVLKTSYYLLYSNDDRLIPMDALFIERNMVAEEHAGRYHLEVVSGQSTYKYAYIGCKVENVYSSIEQVKLDSPHNLLPDIMTYDSELEIGASIHPRGVILPVNPMLNPGVLEETKKPCVGKNSQLRIRYIKSIESALFIRVLVLGGPYDIYYMVRPENSIRGDPDEYEIMRFGERAGSFNDASFDIVLTDYVSSVRNKISLVAVKGKCVNGPTTRRFFP